MWWRFKWPFLKWLPNCPNTQTGCPSTSVPGNAIFISSSEQLLHGGDLQDVFSCFYYLVKTRGLGVPPGCLLSFLCHGGHKRMHWGWGDSYRRQALRGLNVQPHTQKWSSPNIVQPITLPNLQSTSYCNPPESPIQRQKLFPPTGSGGLWVALWSCSVSPGGCRLEEDAPRLSGHPGPCGAPGPWAVGCSERPLLPKATNLASLLSLARDPVLLL